MRSYPRSSVALVPDPAAFLIDAACVLLFVVIGRKSHDEGGALTGTARVVAPFLIALVAGWVGVRRLRPPATNLRFGTVVWFTTVALGMVLRRFVFSKSTAGTFIIVAAVFLGVLLLGWRVLTELVQRRRASTVS